MNLLKPLDFPDSSFDLVNVRFINFLPAAAWPQLVQEFRRITRPGGFIRLTESEWWYFSTSPALETLNSMVIQAIKVQGGFSQTGRFTGILPMLGGLLRDAGCINVKLVSHAIDFSVGTEAYEGFRRDAAVVFKRRDERVLEPGRIMRLRTRLTEKREFELAERRLPKLVRIHTSDDQIRN